MATLDATPAASRPAEGQVSVASFALTGAALFVALFLIGWLSSLFGPIGTMSMAPFMMSAWSSLAGLAFGLFCSVLSGLLAGALTAVSYNLAGQLTP